MATQQTYLRKIRRQVKSDHGGNIPDNLQLTIENYAAALELRDTYREQVIQQPTVIEKG